MSRPLCSRVNRRLHHRFWADHWFDLFQGLKSTQVENPFHWPMKVFNEKRVELTNSHSIPFVYEI